MDSVAKSSRRERTQLFETAEGKHNPRIPAPIVEKDFWVCWALHRLFTVLKFRPQLIFKGGTSLSKVFKVIDRFSEDVDLSLSRRDLGFADARDPEEAGISKNEAKRRLEALVEQCKLAVKEKLLPDLRRDFATVLGESGWSIEVDTDDSQTLVFAYPQSDATSKLKYVRPAIRLEMGARSDDWPAVEAEITPYAAEDFPGMFTQPKSLVRTLSAERTFWEKATLLHAECHRPETKATAERHSRHYYDLYCLSRHEIGREALKRGDLLERVIQHKSFFFSSSWANYATAKPGTLRLVPDAKRLAVLSQDYDEMQAMMFGASPKWSEIIKELKQLEGRING
ncbi:MAG: nucleotidyl transferase AbiEii/AbiGii toxin family protein [Elusimicrobia bacterium]|nr:nucleotidyl transferase AbiEii/AbiGii toxin family protein [Elusimicrobiota bacterium]